MDLPGLFQAEALGQDKHARSTVYRMVNEQIELKTNVVLLVMNAKTPSVNQSVLATFQTVSKKDEGLRGRAIGVLTHPEEQYSEIESFVKGDKERLAHGWLVVKNQNKEERENDESLDDRDRKENEFFKQGNWQNMQPGRTGIENLRFSLKEALWSHTQKALPGIISDINRKICRIEAELKSSDQSRATAHQRRQYLANIAVTFEDLTKRATNGLYENDPCDERHAIGESREFCLKCKGFFPVGSKTPGNSDDQKTKLRSNIRALNMQFAKAMRRFGKTEIIGQDDQTATASIDDEQTRQELQDDLLENYKHPEPKYTNRRKYEEEVSREIKNNRGREPIGEVNSTVYQNLLIKQSSQWSKIAENHLLAVFKTADDFITLALNHVCPDSDAKVYLALREQIIYPNLQGLREEAYSNLKSLEDCRQYASTAIFDSFGDIFTLQEQAGDLEARLSLFGSDELFSENPSELVSQIRSGLKSLIASSIRSPWADDHLKNAIIGKCIDIVSQAVSAAGKAPNGKTVREELTRSHLAETRHLDAARVVEVVETYYKNAMVAFVVYVNALVVENGILRKLPQAILSHKSIQSADQVMIDEIAAEDRGEALKRNQNEQNLRDLKKHLAQLRGKT